MSRSKLLVLALALSLPCSACTFQVVEELREPSPGPMSRARVLRCRTAWSPEGKLRCALTVRGEDQQIREVGDPAWFAAHPDAPLIPVVVVDRRPESFIEELWYGDGRGFLSQLEELGYEERERLIRDRVVLELDFVEAECEVAILTLQGLDYSSLRPSGGKSHCRFGGPGELLWKRAGLLAALPFTTVMDIALLPYYTFVIARVFSGDPKFRIL